MDDIVGWCAMACFLILVMMPYITVLLGVVWLLAALQSKEAERAFRPVMCGILGILFPLLVFVASALKIPEWKGDCVAGWLNCFHVGKLALTPLVLWACAAFAAVHPRKPNVVTGAWIVLGLFMGAVVSFVCLVLGMAFNYAHDDWWFLLVPAYVTVWYAALCLREALAAGIRPRAYFATLLASTPFWAVGAWMCKQTYARLPDAPPSGCFVVTAAQRGHAILVGPFSETIHRGERRTANRQLQRFWAFEAVWQRRFPVTHRIFRHGYNRVGPLIAGGIKTKLVADVVYLLLKPGEFLVNIILKLSENIARLRTEADEHGSGS